ncbi:MAG: tetratricopeptide repeat protein [Deltaproteobacteria bacterium]|jgi:hypothetical protein|nr:tetratricopeptide repeat protein [Deltaproteobacteria bacterium]
MLLMALDLALSGDLEETKELYARSIAIQEKVLSPDNPDAQEAMLLAAHNLLDLKEFAEVEKLFARAHAARLNSLGPEHPLTPGSGRLFGRDLSGAG